ncbi:MAG: hypothetical protein K6T86_02805 [Pirellulales bacterium]|nr:hypothetical protein [Pirellulales bacterium]
MTPSWLLTVFVRQPGRPLLGGVLPLGRPVGRTAAFTANKCAGVAGRLKPGMAEPVGQQLP